MLGSLYADRLCSVHTNRSRGGSVCTEIIMHATTAAHPPSIFPHAGDKPARPPRSVVCASTAWVQHNTRMGRYATCVYAGCDADGAAAQSPHVQKFHDPGLILLKPVFRGSYASYQRLRGVVELRRPVMNPIELHRRAKITHSNGRCGKCDSSTEQCNA